jgi:hypothetical protein
MRSMHDRRGGRRAGRNRRNLELAAIRVMLLTAALVAGAAWMWADHMDWRRVFLATV